MPGCTRSRLDRKHFARSTLRGPDAAPDAAFYGGRHGHPGDRHRRQHSSVYIHREYSSALFADSRSRAGGLTQLGRHCEHIVPQLRRFTGPQHSLFRPGGVSLRRGVQPRDNFRVWGYEATGNYFQTLGVPPFLGRFFGPQEDDKPGGHPVIVISYRCWQSRFAADPKVIGRSVKINGYPFTIIGVAAPSFAGTELIVAADYWVPMRMELQIEPGNEWVRWRTSQNAWVLGRRKQGVSRAQAEANLNQIGDQLARAYPDDIAGKAKFHVSRPGLIGQELRGPISSFGVVLMGVAGLGLLLACVNLAGMLLARASDRRREVGIRLALGASHSQLLRQLMIESLLLAATGGLLGFVLSRHCLPSSRLLASQLRYTGEHRAST